MIHRKEPEIRLPVYLEADVLRYVQARGKDKNVASTISSIRLLKQDVALTEAAK